jgi:hypothetical protein
LADGSRDLDRLARTERRYVDLFPWNAPTPTGRYLPGLRFRFTAA